MRICIFALAAIAVCLGSGRASNAHIGTGIDLDRQGRIYFTDTYHNCIWRLESNGALANLKRAMPFAFVRALTECSLPSFDSQPAITN